MSSFLSFQLKVQRRLVGSLSGIVWGTKWGSATQYFIGDFDGTNFLIDPYFEKQMKINHNFGLISGKIIMLELHILRK